MPAPEKNWKTITRSQFAWEQEALDFIHGQFPAQDNYRAWANFEFVADDGSINEVDLLVACPQGVFLVEIKSSPGDLSGDARDWTWDHEGRRKTVENPVLLANRKCKRLKALLGRQKAFRKVAAPYIDPLVFLSHSGVVSHLSGNAAHYVRLRDTDTRAGIMGAIRRRECPGLKQFAHPPVNRPGIKALSLAMEQAGIRPSRKSRRVGDFELESLLFDSPLGIYQDWTAKHVAVGSTRRVARIYMVARQATGEDREIIGKAAFREFQLLERLDNPGILKADPPTECEYGPVLFLRYPPDSVRLDHFLGEEGDSLPVDQRLDLLRQIGEIVSYAHGRRIVHRSLSPQSVLVRRDGSGRPVVWIYNWQTGVRLAGGDTSASLAQTTMTLHAGQLIEDSSRVYIAPEALGGYAEGGTELDIFSLGALAYLLFTGRAPAASATELQQKLKRGVGLNVTESMDGAVDALVDLVRGSTNGIASDRGTVEDFLAGLDLVEEELTSPEEDVVANPLEAGRGDTLAGGYVVERRLGGGSGAVAFLVSLDGEKQVLKVARDARYNRRIEEEFEVLKEIQEKVRSRIVVAPFRMVEFGELLGFTMESAGEQTMAVHIRRKGPLDLTYLQRFGDDLIRTIRDLDDAGGIAHRDIKPENMGLRLLGKKQYQLCLFDFSLSRASPEEIKVGTPAYLDPFIAERKVKRWDISSECFSAAMTLHEMATRTLPAWGDGRSDPASVGGEVVILPERFDPDLRDGFARFFEKALRRDFRERFDNPEEMLKAWNQIFATLDERKATRTSHAETEDGDRDGEHELPDPLTPATQLVLLGLSTRLLNTLDRLNLVTVADLLGFPLRRIYKLPGVGDKTRRELGALVKLLRKRLPDAEPEPAGTVEEAAGEETDTPESFAGVDAIARQVAVIGRGKGRSAEQRILQAFLGWKPSGKDGDPAKWPGQSELAAGLGVTRQRVGQVVASGRERWRRFPAITALRDTIHEMVRARGGIVTHEELVADVLAARGSALAEPERTRMASVATRAALETERGARQSRFLEYRSDGPVFVAMSRDLKNHAVALGEIAGRLAGEDPLPSPAGVIATLRAAPAPELPEGVPALSDHRLCQLAAAASETAALSSRMEIYPVGLRAGRALILAQNALFGGTLTVEEIRSRVAARLPRAEPVPDRPELDKLIDALGLDLKWNPADADGRGAYEMPGSESPSLFTSEPLTSRMVTRTSPAPPAGVVPPEIAEARAIEEKLAFAAKNGAFLAISVPPGFETKARAELERRFAASLETCDLDALFLERMRAQAAGAGADWNIVLRADAAPQGSPDWKNLQMLVERCLPEISGALRSPDRTILATHPGLLARYDRMDVLAGLAADVGRSEGIHGLWVLLPANDLNPKPVLNHRAVPMTNHDGGHVRLNRTWLANKHRA